MWFAPSAMQSIISGEQPRDKLFSQCCSKGKVVFDPIRAAAIIQLMTNQHEYSKRSHANIRFANTCRLQRGRATKRRLRQRLKGGTLDEGPSMVTSHRNWLCT